MLSTSCIVYIWFSFLIGRIRTNKMAVFSENKPLVSIPHRQDKNDGNSILFLDEINVSIPHRQDKNFCEAVQSYLSLVVSIPHRQDKNENYLHILLILYLQFPFLIGRIRTITFANNSSSVSWFPFLIGRIRTQQQSFIDGSANTFPFLIGRIRTVSKEMYRILQKGFPFLIGRIRTSFLTRFKLLYIQRFHSSQVG